MTTKLSPAGYFRSGIAYNRYGSGQRILVALQGLVFEHKPLTGWVAHMSPGPYRFLEKEYTIYQVIPKRGLPDGYTLKEIAADYAQMIREEFAGPVDVIGISTGGSIAQHLAADYPELVRRLVIHSSAHRLNAEARAVQLRLAELACQGQWRAAYQELFSFLIERKGLMKVLGKPAAWLGALLTAAVWLPEDSADLETVVRAEDQHEFQSRLGEIIAPTLVAAGEKDPFYTPTLFRETAEGIPNAVLILYQGMGHPASGKIFERDVRFFFTRE